MDVQNAPGVSVEQRLPHAAHEASQADQIDVQRREHITNQRGVSVRVDAFRRQRNGVQTEMVRGSKRLGLRLIREQAGDLGIEPAGRDVARDGFKVRAAAGDENG